MNVVEIAFTRLFPNKKLPVISLEYGSLHGFNAHGSLSFFKLKIQMSKKWKNISQDIQIGCVQELLLKLYKNKKVKQSLEIELYNNFIRSLSDNIPATRTQPVLASSFEKLNNKFFDNQLDKANLKFGKGISLLGTYSYQSNTITISRMLLEHPELLDYVMFHEMLHKKHKFYSTKTGRNMHHSTKFRKDEKNYPNSAILEKKLQILIEKKRRENRKNKGFFL